MRADYDSEADALDLELVRFEHYDDQEQVDDDFCTVGFAGGVRSVSDCCIPSRTWTCSRLRPSVTNWTEQLCSPPLKPRLPPRIA
jgi:hypothetical protein